MTFRPVEETPPMDAAGPASDEVALEVVPEEPPASAVPEPYESRPTGQRVGARSQQYKEPPRSEPAAPAVQPEPTATGAKPKGEVDKEIADILARLR